MAIKTNKKRKGINLLPTEAFQSSVLGRILKWALGTFRVMVIVCEMIVMGAFLSRFWLDARSSDLNEEINIAKAQIQAYEPVETEFRSLQKRLLITEELYSQDKASLLIEIINKNMPSDMFLNSISFMENAIQTKSTSLSEKSIIQFITNLESTDLFDTVKLSQVSSSLDNESYLTFTLSTKLK